MNISGIVCPVCHVSLPDNNHKIPPASKGIVTFTCPENNFIFITIGYKL